MFILLLLGVAYTQRVTYSCPSSYYWTGQTCMPCQTGCSCSSYLGCSSTLSCSSGYVLQDGACTSCPTGCSTCSVTGDAGFTCSACTSAYQLINKICVELAYDNSNDGGFQTSLWGTPTWTMPSGLSGYTATYTDCLVLSTTTSLCTKCPSAYFLNEILECESCIPSCTSCTGRGICSTCAAGTYWNPNSSAIQTSSGSGSGACSACTATFAATCDATGAIPLTCLTGYYLTASPASCAQCSQYCNSCTSATSCTTCMDGAYLNSGTCNLCAGNSAGGTYTCQFCNTGKATSCNTCFTGYIIVGNTCQACSTINGCLTCQAKANVLVCQICQNGYYLANGACVLCSSISPNYYLCKNSDESSATANVTPTQCTTVTSTAPFTSSNYFLVGTEGATSKLTCAANTNGCLQMSTSSQTCTSCVDAYVLATGQCVACSTVAGCLTCTAPSTGTVPVCKTCQSGYYLQTNTCTQCTSGCTTCSATGCTQCLTGYLLASSTCNACSITYCATCTSSIATCTTCQPQFYLYTPSGSGQVQQCLLCPPGCSDCQTQQGQACTTCLSGFYKQGNGCTPGSQYCAVNNSDGTCKQCIYGAYINEGSCYPCISTDAGYVCQSAWIMSILIVFLII
ncbi:hypothetical protein pb186bvf_008028 [Paramecium bursaria]